MIKGISRRVIVVKSPDRRFFGEGGVTAEQVVEEARRVADSYVKKHHSRWWHRLPATGYMAIGALLATVVWSIGLLW